MELVQGLTQIRIGTLRERSYALPSAPGKSASQQLLSKMKDFIHRENNYKREPIAPKADLSALYMAVVANPMNYHQ
jgi:hypothetical protein